MEALIIIQMVSDDHFLEKTFEHGPGKMLRIKAEGTASRKTLREVLNMFKHYLESILRPHFLIELMIPQ